LAAVVLRRSILALSSAIAIASPVAYAQTIPQDQTEFTECVADAMRREVGDIPVSVKAPLALTIGSLQANLQRLYVACRKNESACASEIDQYAKGAAQVIKAQNAPIDRAAIRLVIRSSEYIKRAQASLGAEGPALQYRPLVDGLTVVAVLDTPRALRPLNDRDLKNLQISQEQLFETGAANLRTTLKPIAEVAKPVGPGKIGALPVDLYEVGRVSIHADWESLATAQGGTLLVAMPTTDSILYISDASDTAIDALRTLARNTAGKAPNPLPISVLKWTKERWEVVQ